MQTIKTTETIRFDIFIAGDISQAKQVCREVCLEIGLCVTVDPTTFIYTGGEEAGVKVSLINYPRFPSSEQRLQDRARLLGFTLMEKLCQKSFSIVGPKLTEFVSRREEDQP